MMVARNLVSIIALIAATAWCAPTASAAVTPFFDRTAWEGVVSGSFLVTEDFDAETPANFPNNATTAAGILDIETVVPAGAAGLTGIGDGGSADDRNVNGSNYLNLGLDGTPKREMIIHFPEPVRLNRLLAPE